MDLQTNEYFANKAKQSPVTNFCINCIHHKAPKTSTPMLNEVRCFNPDIISTDPSFRVLGHTFQGASCIQERSDNGHCGMYGHMFKSVANPTDAKNS